MRLRRVVGVALLSLVGIIAVLFGVAFIVYPPSYVLRVLVWQESDAFDWQKFPSHQLRASPVASVYPVDLKLDVSQTFARLAGVESWEGFLESMQTQAFLVIQDDRIVYEGYFNGTQRDSIVTSFSVAKSFVSTLIGLAVADGSITSLRDPITKYLPELSARDSRYALITVQDLLLMSSGFEYRSFRPLLLNGDDPLSTYYPDQRSISIRNARIIEGPSEHFNYNKYHPQLLGMILERATGMSVTEYMQKRLWDPAGMEYPGSWSTDSRRSDFEKMETGVNARAVDFAKLGSIFLHEGMWNGRQIIPAAWVKEATAPRHRDEKPDYYPAYFGELPGKPYYGYMWWGQERADGTYDFAAEGDKAQFIYVSPSKNLVIVRHGIDFGIFAASWINLFYNFAGEYE